MTVSPTGPGSEVAPYDPSEYADVGLEDIGQEDVVIPRLSIQHLDAVFKNNLTGEVFEELDAVFLGMVRQRIFWSGEEFEEGDKPRCKSTDAQIGFPQMRTDIAKEKQFPWDESNFNPADYPPRPDLNGLVALPCASCKFAQWEKNGSKNMPPPCNEQYTYPILYKDDQGELVPALFTVQKTGIKPAKAYNSYFASAKTMFFTVWTHLSLTPQSRGTVRWAVPQFKRTVPTDRDLWRDWADQARGIRDLIRQPPRNNDADPSTDSVSSTAANVNTAPASEPAVTTPAPGANPQPATTQPVAPVTAPAAPSAPPAAPAAPTSTPATQPVAPAQPSAPDAESVPSGQATPIDDDDDDIPF